MRTTERLVEIPALTSSPSHSDFDREQWQDPNLSIIQYLEDGQLPADEQIAKQIVLCAAHFSMDDAILYYVDPKVGSPGKVVVPSHLQGKIMAECHGQVMSGQFAGKKLYNTLHHRWWWDTMYRNSMSSQEIAPSVQW